ncbi:MAG: hypothetical protein ACRC20_03605 [Segniliparus sp.]|uniref:hypothetical protein n=1 Tax=Segniliparus sp. TaxID=2804064 RepID=UPI003F2D39A5
MKHTTFSRTGSRLAVAAPLAAIAALLAAPSFAAAAPGDLGTRCADFLSSRPETQVSIVRDILSYRGASLSASSGADASLVNSAIAGCQSNFGGSVSEVLGGH